MTVHYFAINRYSLGWTTNNKLLTFVPNRLCVCAHACICILCHREGKPLVHIFLCDNSQFYKDGINWCGDGNHIMMSNLPTIMQPPK